MIIYDKDYNLVGMDTNTLTLLGYEDISVFTTYNNDVSDLFIKKHGYIHKFDNFSWINYILSGGAPNKDALIKLRSEKVAQATLLVKEVSLINSEDKMYIIELENFKIIDDQDSYKNSIFNLAEETKVVFDDLKIDDERVPLLTPDKDEAPQDGALNSEEMSEIKLEYTFDDEDEASLPPKEETLEVLDEEAKLIKKIFIDDEDDELNIKHDTDPIFLDEKLLSIEDLNSNVSTNTLPNDSIEETKEVLSSLDDDDDLCKKEIFSSEDESPLEIDKETIREYTKEFANYLAISVEQIKELLKNSEDDAAYDLVGKLISIGNILQTKYITEDLKKFYNANSNLEKEETLNILEEDIKCLIKNLQ